MQSSELGGRQAGGGFECNREGRRGPGYGVQGFGYGVQGCWA